jgi:outer membrane immunogenic protein
MRSEVLWRVLIAGAALMLAGQARADEVAPATSPDWSGVYGGAIGGFSKDNFSQSAVTGGGNSGTYSLQGALAGATLGFNYQFGQWVFGLDSELSKAFVTGSKTPGFSGSIDSVLAVKARFGYSVGDFLPFISLGPTYGQFSSAANFPGVGAISDNELRVGWLFGAGFDYMITPRLFARFEYDFICFGAALLRDIETTELMGSYFRVGLDYKFDVAGLKKEEETSASSVDHPYNWSGFYIGPSVGGSAAYQHTSFSLDGIPITPAIGSNFGAGGIVGFGLQGTIGGQAGANWQVGQFIIGVETDFHLSQLTGAGMSPHFVATTAGVTGVMTQSDTMGEQGTIRARLGLPLDRWLIYVTAGLAYGEVESDSQFTTPAASSSAGLDTTRLGPVAGLGVERAIWGNWTARFEYMYADFGQISYGLKAPAPFGVVNSDIGVSEHILRVGFNLIFN